MSATCCAARTRWRSRSGRSRPSFRLAFLVRWALAIHQLCFQVRWHEDPVGLRSKGGGCSGSGHCWIAKQETWCCVTDVGSKKESSLSSTLCTGGNIYERRLCSIRREMLQRGFWNLITPGVLMFLCGINIKQSFRSFPTLKEQSSQNTFNGDRPSFDRSLDSECFVHWPVL